MKRLLLFVILAIFSAGSGVAAGYFLRPHSLDAAETGPKPSGPAEYVKLNNQFIVPVMQEGRVSAMVVLSLSIEVPAGQSETVLTREPKLRDAFLQVMFNHANAGGFRGSFTETAHLLPLRKALLEKASELLGQAVIDVLITDIARQDH